MGYLGVYLATAKDLGIEALRGADMTSDRQIVVEVVLDSRTVLSAEKSPDCLSFHKIVFRTS